MEKEQLIKIIEGLLYMTDHPLSIKELNEVIEDKDWPEPKIKELVEELAQKWAHSDAPLQVMQVAGGVQMATKPELSSYIRKLYKERLTVRLSPSALETLSIVAYKQPIARSEIEQIRGVEVTGVIETLLERRLIKVVGRKETIGRPLLYGTTSDFLRQFGLNHLTDLPDLEGMVPEQKDSQLLINVNKASHEEMNFEEVRPENSSEPQPFLDDTSAMNKEPMAVLEHVEASVSPSSSDFPSAEPDENS